MLEITDLYASYNSQTVLNSISLSVGLEDAGGVDSAKGSVVGLAGRNGVGKSTLLKCIIGLVPQRRGEIILDGENIVRWPPARIVHAGIGYVPQGRRIFPHLTVRENLDLVPTPGHRNGGLRKSVLNQFPVLARRMNQLAGTLSGGEQQMLSIVRALLLNPSLLLMDEPTEGLDSYWTNEVCLLINALRKQGKQILMVEHDLEVLVRLCDKIYVTHRGIIVYEGHPEVSGTYRDELLAKMGLLPALGRNVQSKEVQDHVSKLR